MVTEVAVTNRNVRVGVFALIYSTVHYVALGKEIAKWLGIEYVPLFFVVIFEICLYVSVTIVAMTALYMVLKVTEKLSRLGQTAIERFMLLIDHAIEYCRRGILLFAEALVERLKAGDALEEPNGRQQ